MPEDDGASVESSEEQPKEIRGYHARRGKLESEAEKETKTSPHEIPGNVVQRGKVPGIVERTKSWISDLKQGHEQRIIAGEDERRAKAARRLKSESERYNVVEKETRARRIMQERQMMERSNREAAMQNIPLIGGFLANRNSRTHDNRGIFGGSDSPLRMAMAGISAQEPARYRHSKRSKQYREPEPYQSPAMAAMTGNGGGGMLTRILSEGRSNRKEQLPPMAAAVIEGGGIFSRQEPPRAARRNLREPQKERLSPLQAAMLRKNEKRQKGGLGLFGR